jgi:hypothetical protein
MAGAGAKKFPAFSKLSSDDVNNYLADQVIMRFATTTARDAAFGGVGEPTLAEGMTAYIDDLNSIQTYDGSNWVEIANTASKAPRGLVAISALTTNTSFLNAETNRTSVSFTAVANRNYKVTYFEPNLNNSQNNTTGFFLRLDGVGATLLSSYAHAMQAGYAQVMNIQYIGTFTAGTRTLFINGNTNAGTATVANASSTSRGFLMVEDLGIV